MHTDSVSGDIKLSRTLWSPVYVTHTQKVLHGSILDNPISILASVELAEGV